MADDPQVKPEKNKLAAEPAQSGFAPRDEYRDGREQWDWLSKYPLEARRGINIEAGVLLVGLFVVLIFSAIALSVADQTWTINLGGKSPSQLDGISATVVLRFVAIYFVGCVGGVTFAIKWLVHSVATGRWHLDRRYWRLMIPWLGGVYALVILAFMDSGVIGGVADKPHSIAATASLAFLVGYFSDGVSGLLSNIANAVFGTLEKK
jgi:hypothetical protein